ncbi:MAG: hypothetical protein AAFR15_19740 [Cyanobacteria bacterium J06627_15]
MAYGELTLAIPGASPPIQPLVLRGYAPDDEAYSRNYLGLAQAVDFSAYGSPLVDGPLTERYVWAIAAHITEQDALQLEALILWSSDQYKSRQDGALLLTDEVERAIAEPAPHSRTLLSATAPTWAPTWQYGYMRCRVIASLAEDNPRMQLGRMSDGEDLKLVQFGAIEVGVG